MRQSIKKSIYDFSIENNLPHILKEYKGDVDSKKIGFDSTKEVEWECDFGHKVIESPHARLRRKGAFCPVCGKDRCGSVLQKDAEMAKLYSKSNPIPVDKMPSNSSVSVEWTCRKSHTWNRTVSNQLKIRTCPVCANRVPSEKYSLFALHPELIAEWDEEKNAGIDTSKIMPNANRKFSWKCDSGHEYLCSAADRHRGKNCPYCAGKKVIESESIYATDREIVDKYWNYDKNKYSPKELPRESKRKVWITENEVDKLITVADLVKKH